MAGSAKTAAKQRLAEPDLLRTLALLGVIAQHILGTYSHDLRIGPFERMGISVCYELVRFAVPAFVFLFGMMLTRSSKRTSPMRYIGKRAWQLLWPYAIWSIYYYFAGGCGRLEGSFVKSLALGGAAYHLWYVPMIFQFALLAPLFTKLFDKLEGSRRPMVGWAVLGIAGLCVMMLPQLFAGRQGVLGYIYRWGTRLCSSWMVYFIAGALAGRRYDSFCRLVKRWWWVCLMAFAAGTAPVVRADFGVTASTGSVSFAVINLQQPHIALLELCGIVCVWRLAMAVCKAGWVRSVCAFCGKHSYRAYLAHADLLNRVNMWLVLSVVEPTQLHYGLLLVIAAALSLALGSAVDMIYDGAGKLVGMIRRKVLN